MVKRFEAEFMAGTRAGGVKTQQERLFLVWLLAGIRVNVMEGLGRSPILSVAPANLAGSIGLESSDELCVHKPLNSCRGTNLTVWNFLRFHISNCSGAKLVAMTRSSLLSQNNRNRHWAPIKCAESKLTENGRKVDKTERGLRHTWIISYSLLCFISCTLKDHWREFTCLFFFLTLCVYSL